MIVLFKFQVTNVTNHRFTFVEKSLEILHVCKRVYDQLPEGSFRSSILEFTRLLPDTGTPVSWVEFLACCTGRKGNAETHADDFGTLPGMRFA